MGPQFDFFTRTRKRVAFDYKIMNLTPRTLEKQEEPRPLDFQPVFSYGWPFSFPNFNPISLTIFNFR